MGNARELVGIYQTYNNNKPRIDEDVDFGIKALLLGEKIKGNS